MIRSSAKRGDFYVDVLEGSTNSNIIPSMPSSDKITKKMNELGYKVETVFIGEPLHYGGKNYRAYGYRISYD